MTNPPCPACTLEDVLSHADHWECSTCGHEWPKDAAPAAMRIVKDAHGNVLTAGDTIACRIDGVSLALKACFVKKA